MDNNLLKQLIAQHRRVVIPDFGAFLKKEGPRGEQLVFSPFLRKDDGMVTEALIREYGVESEDARGMLSEFVVYLRQSLASSGRYYIEGIGMLAADANGSITLKEGVMPERSRMETEGERTAARQMPHAAVEQVVEAEPVPVMPKPPVMPRPQTIQVQPPMGQPGQAASVFGNYPGIQQQPIQPPRPQAIPQQMQPQMPQQPVQPQQPMAQPMPQQPQPMRPQQMGGQQPIQQPGGGRPMPHQPGRPGQPMQQPQPQSAGGRPMQPQQQQGGGGIIPPSQRQPQQQGNGRPMPRDPQAQARPQRPGQRPAPYPSRRPPVRRKPQKTKADLWLIVAIIAALVVIAIMIYSFIVSGGGQDIDMDMLNEMMSPMQEGVSATAEDL